MNDLRELWDKAPVTTLVAAVYVVLGLVTLTGDPMWGDFDRILRLGACVPFLVVDGEPWRMLTAAFLHFGILHLGLNLWALIVLGPGLERHYGSLRFALLYLVGALGGNIAFQLWSLPLDVGAGGSGALFAMLGGALAYHVRAGRTSTAFLDNYGARQLLSVIGLNLALGLMIPQISNSAHLGGLVAGFVLGFCFLDRGRWRPDRTSRVIQAGWILLFVMLLLWCVFPVTRVDYQEWSRDPEQFRQLAARVLRDR